MKKIQKIASLFILAFLSFSTFAQEVPKEEGMTQPGMMEQGKKMQKGMMGKMSGMSEEQKEQHMRGMQEHMLMMHELSNEIIAEKDPAKKQALKDRQLEMMKAHRAQMMGHMKKMKH